MDKIEFKVKKKEYLNRNIRFEKELFEEGTKFAQQEGISFNMLVNQCLMFALEHRKKN